MADKNSKPVKAVRATIDIGGITLNVYQLPDGSYRLSGRNVTDAIDEDDKTLPRFYGVRKLKDLPHADLSLPQVKANTGESFVPISIEDAMDYWLSRVAVNEKARSLARALMSESIERRADRQFHIERTEAERDERLKTRVQGKLTRANLEEAIHSYIQAHPETSEGYRKWLYKNATDRIIIELWGKTRKAIAADRGITTSDSLRDIMEAPELAAIDRIEDLTARLILQEKMEPQAAATEAVKRTLTQGLFANA